MAAAEAFQYPADDRSMEVHRSIAARDHCQSRPAITVRTCRKAEH